jgi:hypothetical protein
MLGYFDVYGDFTGSLQVATGETKIRTFDEEKVQKSVRVVQSIFGASPKPPRRRGWLFSSQKSRGGS